MVDSPPQSNRAGMIVALIIGLPLAVTLLGLFVAGPLSSGPAAEIPTGCSEPFVDEVETQASNGRVFAEISRFRLFDCGDRFVAVIEGAGDAEAAFTSAEPVAVASVALLDQFGGLHERRVVTSGAGEPVLTSQRGDEEPEAVSLDAVGYDDGALVVVFVRGRGEEVLTRVEVTLTERSGSTTVHDDLAVDF